MGAAGQAMRAREFSLRHPIGWKRFREVVAIPDRIRHGRRIKAIAVRQ